MISSNEVNALMMQQQQQQMMLGMGAPSAVVGQSQYPPQFNFGASPLISGQLSGGSGFGSMAASGVQGAGSMLGMGAMASGFLPASIAGSMGGGFIGGALGFAGINPLGLALGAGAAGIGAVGNAMNTGIQTNNRVGQMLSAANFANPNAPNGFGFSFGDQARMSGQVIGMGASNPFVGQQDQMQLMGQFQQMGLDKGVTSMGKMIEKFKEFSKTTEEVATQLGKTVTEVTGLVQNLRGSGFYSAQEVTGMSARMSSSASYGINMQQQQQMMQNMAGQARGMGLTGASGSMLGVNLAQAFGSANQLGHINENNLMDMTGTTNSADASQAMAQMLGGRFSGALSQGGVLEKLLGGFTSMDSSGNMAIDENIMKRVASGGMSFDALKGRTSDMLGGRNKAAFETNKRRLASDFLKSDQGMGAILGTFKGMASERAQGGDISEEEAFKLLMKEYNIADERQSDMLYDMASNLDEVMSNNLKNRAQTLASEKRRAFLQKHRSFAGLKAKAGHELGKITNNPYIAAQTAKASTSYDAGINALERSMFGVEDSTAGLYTASGTGQFRNAFLSGELDSLGGLGGSGADRYKATLAARVSNLKDYEGFNKFVTGGMSDAHKGVKLDTSSFEYHTDYHDRDTNSFMTNYTGVVGDSMLGGILSDRGIGTGKTFFAADDTRDFEDLIAEAKRKGGPGTTDQEAYAMIANQSDEASDSLQRYLKRKGDLGQESMSNKLQQQFLQSAGGEMGYAMAGGVAGGIGAGGAGYLGAGMLGIGKLGAAGAVAGMSTAALAATGVGAIALGVAGAAYGIMKYGDEKEFEAQLKGSAGNLLAKLGSKGKLRNFDEKYKKAIRDNGGDEEAAKQQVAKEMSEELGEAVSAEDVGASLKAIYRSSGQQDYKARLKSGDYAGALKMTEYASGYQKLELAKGHLTSMRDSLLDEDVEGIEGLQDALASGGEDIIPRSREALLDLARKSATGEFTYDGDNAALQAVASAGDKRKEFMQFKGKSIKEFDKKYGKGTGDALRELAGVRKGGKLGEKELTEMAAKLAASDALKTTEVAASVGTTDTIQGQGDDDILNATKSLVSSTQKLTVYVDNIASVLTGNEVAGQKLPGMDKIDIKRNN